MIKIGTESDSGPDLLVFVGLFRRNDVVDDSLDIRRHMSALFHIRAGLQMNPHVRGVILALGEDLDERT